jgi:hypothetical protein
MIGSFAICDASISEERTMPARSVQGLVAAFPSSLRYQQLVLNQEYLTSHGLTATPTASTSASWRVHHESVLPPESTTQLGRSLRLTTSSLLLPDH